ncbi:MAG: glycosyl transferase family 1 [Alphaproteobacteria bacterium]|nr:glycosyl transferase family 1 [Alphaproteobacteria bacterium]
MQESEKATQLILVLGMHRSGTSALTRGLKVINVSLSDSLIGPLPANNPKGFFEDTRINQINDSLLAELGLQWCSQGELKSLDIRVMDLSHLRDRAYTYLSDLLKDKGDFFALKDPRFSILLPFWQPIFEELNVKVNYIIASRHPMSVAHSLQKRDDLAIQRGLLLWYRHMLAALNYTQGQKRLVVNYDILMDNTDKELERVALFLKVDTNIDPEKLNEYKDVFLEKELRHNYYEGGLSETLPELAPSIHDLHNMIEGMSKENIAGKNSFGLISSLFTKKKVVTNLFCKKKVSLG